MSTLEIENVIGFAGDVSEGLIAHPDRKNMIYPLGSNLVIAKIANPKEQLFLQGHSNKISCVAVSPSGRYIATGQITHMGFQADIIVWDYEKLEKVHTLTLHKVKVQSLSFSPSEKYLASLGGQDDNNIVIWDVETGEPVCGSPASNDLALTIQYFQTRDDMLVTGGNYNLRVWEFDVPNRKIRPTDCNLGQLKRVYTCIYVDENDEFMYCGSTSGDLIQVNLATKLFRCSGPKTHFSEGVNCITQMADGDFIVGAGDGTVAKLRLAAGRGGLTFLPTKSARLQGSVTSLARHPGAQYLLIGTNKSNMYSLTNSDFKIQLRSTCHYSRINDIAFPEGYADVFATCSMNDIRVWNSRTGVELLRINVQGVECYCITFMKDGGSIVSGWSDGKIRAFGPQSGAELYSINDAHQGGVTALACTSDNERLISGGEDGQVRVWKVTKQSRVMIASMKEHKSTVNDIRVRANDSECVSASSDGSCIIWDMSRFARNNSLFASTFFKSILYHPDESQLLTCGTDRKITYWDAYDGSGIRIIDGSETAELNSIDISRDGKVFASGASDKTVKLWLYDEGEVTHEGFGHSGNVVKVKMSPDGVNVISVGEEGAIFKWRLPH
uniref:Cilia- and flagella-associated protein 52 n=1 Tax=Palpitomonas bilix TaxID=652834 RepID=A0A7S3LVG9_9EUKA|mmetsp:Transcript_49975/g.128614  ORF Transcript_49975/g.128614 Transcript_49975/m.128614 type:complete len:612 (+) Transcript_49975:156-1991(+)